MVKPETDGGQKLVMNQKFTFDQPILKYKINELSKLSLFLFQRLCTLYARARLPRINN